MSDRDKIRKKVSKTKPVTNSIWRDGCHSLTLANLREFVDSLKEFPGNATVSVEKYWEHSVDDNCGDPNCSCHEYPDQEVECDDGTSIEVFYYVNRSNEEIEAEVDKILAEEEAEAKRKALEAQKKKERAERKELEELERLRRKYEQ